MWKYRAQGGAPTLGHTRDVQPEWVKFGGVGGQKLAGRCEFLHKTCGWVITDNASGLVVISIILPGNGYFSCSLNKTRRKSPEE